MNKEIICPKCKGEGGKDIFVPTSPQNVMWISEGECMELGWENCKKCNGTGKIIVGDKK